MKIYTGAETHNEIVIKAFTTNGQSRELHLSMTVCGTELIKSKSDGSESKFILPVGLNDGKVTFDLSKENDDFGYKPFFEVESRA